MSPSSAVAAASSSSVLRLAKATLLSASSMHNKNATQVSSITISHLKETSDLFSQLATALASTNHAPPMPRVPQPSTSTTRIDQAQAQHETMERILKRSAAASSRKMSEMMMTPLKESGINGTYGTTPLSTIMTLLDELYVSNSSNSASMRKNGLFVDAGSGMGVPTIAAALSNRFHKAKGIEFEEKWHSQALIMKDAYDHVMAEQHQEQKQEKPNDRDSDLDSSTLEYICDDVTNDDAGHFTGASCIFMNSATWDAELCRHVSLRIEEDTTHNKETGLEQDSDGEQRRQQDVFVVSMCHKMALPSFDLIDILSMDANGGTFNFFISRKSEARHDGADNESKNRYNTVSNHFNFAVSDSEPMRELRESSSGTILKELIAFASNSACASPAAGLQFLAAVGASEPSVRTMILDDNLWKSLVACIGTEADLATRALGSMVFRSMVDHAVGRRAVSDRTEVVDAILAAIGRKNDHPMVRANLLDVLGNVLCDSPLEHASDAMGVILKQVRYEAEQEGNDIRGEVIQALEETLAMRRWWRGEQRRYWDC